jgi:2-aminoadipate transaminase
MQLMAPTTVVVDDLGTLELPRMIPQQAGRMNGAASSAIRDILEAASRQSSNELISFSGGVPAPSLFPRERLEVGVSSILRDEPVRSLQYGPTRGELRLREVINAREPNRGTSDEVVITTGSQQGIDLLCRGFLDEHDEVLVSQPEYVGALQVFRSYGATTVPMGEVGSAPSADAIETLIASGSRPKIAYLVPNFRNPTGESTSIAELLAITVLAERHGFLLCLDDPYRSLSFSSEQSDIDAWSRCVRSPNVVYLGSVSKVLAPGLRVGWLTGSPEVIDAIVLAKQSTDLHTSTFCQYLVAELLSDETWFQGHLDQIRAHYTAHGRHMEEAVKSEFGSTVRTTDLHGGMFLWLECLWDVDTSLRLNDCMEAGVAYVPGRAFQVRDDLGRFLRLSFATASIESISAGVALLGKALR